MPTLSEIETTLRATLDARSPGPGAARDLDAIMRHLTDHCIYGASLGPEPGTTFRGQAEVRAGIAAVLAHDDAAESQTTGLVITGNRAFWEWRLDRSRRSSAAVAWAAICSPSRAVRSR
jgi:SnoaL-like domain